MQVSTLLKVFNRLTHVVFVILMQIQDPYAINLFETHVNIFQFMSLTAQF